MIVWLCCFLVTLAVELAVVSAIGSKLRLPRLAPVVILANVATHPLAYLWLDRTESARDKLVVFLASELLLIPIVEAGVYAKAGRLSPRDALGLSYLANAASLFVGLVAAVLSA